MSKSDFWKEKFVLAWGSRGKVHDDGVVTVVGWGQEAGSWPLEGKHKTDRDRGQRQQEVGEAINPSPVSPMWTYFSNMWDYGSYLRCDWIQIIKRSSKK